MNTLIIVASPSSSSYSHKIVSRYVQNAKKQGHKTEILDLYNTELKQDFLAFEDKRAFGKDPVTLEIQKKINWADELVFVFPIWWADAPAILKNFFDANFGAGYAFTYENGKPRGLLTGKTARFLVTCSAPKFFYSLILKLSWVWNLGRTGFCGIKTKSFTIFDQMDTRKEAEKVAMLGKIDKLFA